MSRTSVTNPKLVEDSSKTRELTQAINKLTIILVILNLILIILTVPIAVESFKNLLT